MKYEKWQAKKAELDRNLERAEREVRKAEKALDHFRSLMSDEERDGLAYLEPLLLATGWIKSDRGFQRAYSLVEFNTHDGKWDLWADCDRPGRFFGSTPDVEEIPTLIAAMEAE